MASKYFNWKQYIDNYPDLLNAGINNKHLAIQHWLNHGFRENRTDKKIDNVKKQIQKAEKDKKDAINLCPIKKYLNEFKNIKSDRKKPVIGIDCQPIQHEYRGIGRYCINLINKIVEKNKKYDIILIFNNFIDTIYYKENLSKLKIKGIKTVTFNFDSKFDIFRKLNTNATKELKLEEQYAKYIDSLYLDIFINLSEFDLVKISFIKDLSKNKYMKRFSIVHDLIPLDYPERFLENEIVKKVYLKHFENLKSYDVLLSNSKSTMKRVEKSFKNVYNIGCGVNFDIKKDLSEYTIKNILQKYGINRKYLFVQSSYDPHKGFDLAIEQYSKLDQNIKMDLQLVFGTSYSNDNVPDHLKQIYEENIQNKNLIITGRLTDEELSALHSAAWLFICPSEYEGFGLPIVEAWVHDRPVIVAKNSSLIDIMDDDRFMFERDDSLSILINNIYYDQNLYSECVKKSDRKFLFTWDIVYDNLEKIFNKPKISIVCLVKNNENWFEYFSRYISKIESTKDFIFEYFFYENNSSDNSKKLVEKFMKIRSGKYLCENIDNTIKWISQISIERGIWMTYLRDAIKKMHGILNSEYTFLLDTNIVLDSNTFNNFVKTFEDNTISVVSPYTTYNRSSHNHYYDSLALFTLSGLNYINTGNTCPFKHCKSCIKHRITKGIQIDENHLLDINNRIIDVYVVFGGCSMYLTKYYNLYDYSCTELVKKQMVCEHYHFVEKFKENGRIVINTDIKLCMKENEYNFLAEKTI